MNPNTKIKILLILIVSLSCKNSNDNIDFTGKWYSYTKDSGYVEYTIDKIHIKAFGHWFGNLGHRKYTSVKDSTYNNDYHIIAKKISNSQIILNSKDTLIKMNDSIATYHEINNLSDSIMSQFYDNFYKRAHRIYIKHKYYTRVMHEQSLIDTLTIDTLLIEEKIILKTSNNKDVY